MPVSTPEQQPPPWRAVFAGARGRLTTGLLLLEALVAIEIMVVATILPAVEADLHGLSLYGWVFVSLTLASFVTVPIAGRMTDRLGPRPVLGVSIAFYVVGLVLAAAAPTMLDPGRRAVRAGDRRRRPVHGLARHGREDLPRATSGRA